MDNRRKKWYDFLGLAPRTIVRWLIILSFIPLTLGVILGVYAWRAGNFDMDKVLAPLESSAVYDHKGNLIGTISEYSRVNATREDLPDDLVNAFVAREDEDFFSHSGLVYSSMLRSLLSNLTSFSYVQGGSTITMQLARNTFELKDKSMDRKILEIAIARRIENKYDKDTILTSYLNRIYFGEQCYGIAQAADYYFGKRVKDLNLSQCATLAGLVRGPSIFNPVKNNKAAVAVRNETLERMVECEFITRQQADAAKQEPIAVTKTKTRQTHSYPVQLVSRELAKIDGKAGAETSRIYVLTTFDLGIQRALELLTEPLIRELENSPVWKGLPKRTDDLAKGCLQIAALCTESSTGNVLAVSGGRCPLDDIDRWAVKRKLGRLFLPIVNLGAADANRNIVRDTPIQTGRQVGYARIIELANLAGISDNLPATDQLYEGNFETPLCNVVQAFLMIQQKGRKIELSATTQVATNNNILIYSKNHHPSETNKEIFKREAAFVAATLPPFSVDVRKKASVHLELPAYSGRFDCIIGPRYSVFLWLGFDEPKEEYMTKKGVARAIAQLGEDITEQMYQKIIAARDTSSQKPAPEQTPEAAPTTTANTITPQ